VLLKFAKTKRLAVRFANENKGNVGGKIKPVRTNGGKPDLLQIAFDRSPEGQH
jgi:hypothetical protein